MIRKHGAKYEVWAESGRKMGTYPSRKQAAERLRQIEAAKHAKGGKGPEGVGSEPALAVWARRYEGAGELPVPASPQATDATCGPAVLRSALLYHFPGAAPDEALLALLAGTTDDGTPPETLASAASACGLQAVVREGMTPADLADELAAGRLVIVGLQAWADDQPQGYSAEWEHGHYVLCVGAEAGRFTFVDPALEEGRATLDRHELEERWHFADQRGRHGLGVVLDGPRRADPVAGLPSVPMG